MFEARGQGNERFVGWQGSRVFRIRIFQPRDGGGGSAAEPVQLIGLKAGQVRYVKFAINANWGDSCYVGLGEVKFFYTRHDGTLIRIY